MKATLKKDIVIPAGTVFDTAAAKTERHGEGHVEAIFGLSKNSSGVVNYFIEESDMKELSEYFDIQ